MAIKERKQITGTTAQINAYAGHEGQIVWDKDKKTFVGMSGAVGKNYPLAPKEYVDNEVAKLQQKGDYATKAQLTEGLEGKEDKGVCLPLTGGTLTGPLYITKDHVITSISDEAYKGLELYGGPSTQKGAFLVLRHNDATNEAGRWYLASQNITTGQQSYFIGGADNLWFNNQELERIQETFSSTVNANGEFRRVIRYTSGLQIMYASLKIPRNSLGVMLLFDRPFASDDYAVSAIGRTPYGNVLVSFDPSYNTAVGLYRTNNAGGIDFDLLCTCIIIGRWK